VAATGFPAQSQSNRDERPVMVNGKPAPYAEQLFSPGSPACQICREPVPIRQAPRAPTLQTSTPLPDEDVPAPEETTAEDFSIHGQFTDVTQYHPPFTSPFYGPNSLTPGHRGNETIDLTFFAGLRPWDGLEAM
jgi:hypothetical protein